MPGIIPEFTLADRLRKAREITGLNQRDFANEIGVNRNSVGNYETGMTKPRPVVLRAWALRTGVPAMWLETGEAPSPGGDGASEWCAPRDSNPEPIDLGSWLRMSSRHAAVSA